MTDINFKNKVTQLIDSLKSILRINSSKRRNVANVEQGNLIINKFYY